MNILDMFGYCMGADATNSLTKIHPLTYFLFALIFSNLLIFDYSIIRNIATIKPARNYFLAIVLLFAYLFLSGKASAVGYILDTLLMPVLVFAYLRRLPAELARKAPHYAMLFILFNSVVAIVERLLSTNFFPIETDFGGLFRSTALLGHPLNNALITFIFIVFLLSTELSIPRKSVYLLILLLALTCFGARGSLYVSILAIGILYVYPVFFSRKQYFQKASKVTVVLILVMASAGMFYLILFTPFGERLVDASFFDEDSAGARVEALDLVNLNQPANYLWAKPQEEIDYMMHIFDIFIIENFFIVWILKFGLIFTFILSLTLLLFLFLNNLLQSKIYSLIILTLFIMTASTNNSLATSTTAISIFIILFSTPTIKYRFVL
jgi:hypothetical protein